MPNRHRQPISYYIRTLAIALLLTIASYHQSEGQTTSAKQKLLTVELEESDAVLTNPGKGWVLYGKPGGYPEQILKLGTVGYQRFNWADLEPQEGRYNWEILDNYIKAWQAVGKKAAFGVMNLNTHNKSPYSTPQWVFAAGAGHRLEDLSDVKWSTTGVPGLKAIPVFDDPVFMQKLANFLKALGQRYDGHPGLAFIDVRSYGNWGEGHMYPFKDNLISAATLQQHFRLHLNSFRKTLLVQTYGKKEFDAVYDWAVTQGMGTRRDGIGGNSDGSETIRSAGKTPAVFELFGDYAFMKERGWWDGRHQDGNGYTLASCVEKGKPSYIGMRGSDVKGYLAHEMPLVHQLANRMGYHFVPRRVVLPATVKAGAAFPVTLAVQNRGVAPLYETAQVAFALAQHGKIIAVYRATTLNPHRWLPDALTEQTEKATFPKVPAGSYTLLLGLFRNPHDTEPTYKLGIKGEVLKGWYGISDLMVR